MGPSPGERMRGGGALPAGTRVGRVRLQVADLARSLGFYRDTIGFRVLEREDRAARLGAHGAAERAPTAGSGSTDPGDASGDDPGDDPGDEPGPVLLELIERPGARPVPRTGLLGIYHFALLLPGRPALGRFLRRQAREGVRFGAADHAFSEALYLEDPDGITIEVYADRPREQWRTEAGPSGAGDARGRPGTSGTSGGSGAAGAVAAEGRRGLPLVSDPIDASGLMAAAGDADWSGVPAGSTIGHMHFFVDDLDAAGSFYVDGLGLEPMIDVPTALFVAAGGYHHHVGLNTWRAGVPTAGEDDARLLDWELVVPDQDAREAVAARLEAAGYDVERGARGVGGSAAPDPAPEAGAPIVARDPWGITVRVTG